MIDVSVFPDSPGVYLMKDKDDNIIYVGKATSLKNRISSYFHTTVTSSKTSAMLTNVFKIDYITTKTELDALLLESSLIKKHKPKYNVMWKDDKTYPFIKITLNEEFPKILVTRQIFSDNAIYFGPYVAGGIRKMLKLVQRHSPIRDCSLAIPCKISRPCLKEQLSLCCAPCVGKVTKEQYFKYVQDALDFLNGKQQKLLKNLEIKMKKASDNLQFEEASEYRDKAELVKLLIEQSSHKLQLSNFAKDERKKQLSRKALLELKQILNLEKLPEKIEAYDISNFTGKEAVGSLVVFQNGEPSKAEYRRFKIKNVSGQDDCAMLSEVVKRRYIRLVEQKDYPDLILVDGGKGQLNAALKVLEELNIKNLPIIGLAKQKEEIYTKDRERPFKLPNDSVCLHLLQHIRDESHRFAINYHRKLLRKTFKVSVLDDISGIGKKRKEILLKNFKTIDGIRNTNMDKIAKLLKINRAKASQVLAKI